MVTASAPGKLFILGEHAVVYGYPAIIVAINKRIYVSSEITRDISDKFVTPGVDNNKFITEAVNYYKSIFSIKKGLHIETRSDFSDNLGFGSSSAVTVATIASLNELFNQKLSKKDIFTISFEIVKRVQGISSGADLAASVYGGMVYYQKDYEPINIHLFDSTVSFIVGFSGAKANTVQMVKNVEKLYFEKKELIEKIFIVMSNLVKKGKSNLENNDYVEFGECMNKNHIKLQELGVSTEILDKMVTAARENGARGAKLSGAGGGDCIVAIGPKNKRKSIEEAIESVGGEVIDAKISLDGVKII